MLSVDVTQDSEFTLTVTGDAVLKSLLKFRPDKSPGPGNRHPMLLRESAQNIAEPLTLIFQRLVKEGRVPGDWKKKLTSHLSRRRDQNAKLRSTDLYVSLTSSACKILESIIKVQMTAYLEIRR